MSSFTSVSLDPPLVSICLGHAVSLIETFRAANYFGINILAEEQRALCRTTLRARATTVFKGLPGAAGQTGVPLIDGVLAAIECQVEQRIPVGDHDIFVGRMVATRVPEGAPLLHFGGGYRKMQL